MTIKMTDYQACGIIEGFDYPGGYEGHEEEWDIAAWQQLIDSGAAWSLQGSYGRQAMNMIEAGLCRRPEQNEDEEDHYDENRNDDEGNQDPDAARIERWQQHREQQ